MITATTVLELFNMLPQSEQEKCRRAIAAAVSPAKSKRKKTVLRPEHATDELVYAMIVRERNIRFKNTDVQAEGLLNQSPKACGTHAKGDFSKKPVSNE